MAKELLRSSGTRIVAAAMVAVTLASCGGGGSEKRAARSTTSTTVAVPADDTTAPVQVPTTPSSSTTSPAATTAPAVPRVTTVPKATAPTTTVAVRGPASTSRPATSGAPSIPAVSDEDAKALAVAKVRSLGRFPGEFVGFGAGRLGAITTTRNTADGKGILVLFFDRGRYLRSDAPEESVDAQISSSGPDTVVVSYRLYGADDPFCCPTGGLAKVRFKLDGGRLVTLDRVPPVSGAVHR